MAKTKPDKKTTKKVVEEEEPLEQEADAEPEADADEPAADADAEAEADADAADTEAADADEGDGADKGDDEEEKAAPPPAPKPKLTTATIVLILLNWIAAPTFLILAIYDHTIHTQHSYVTLLNYTQIWGIPLEMETDLPSLSNESRPVMRLSSAQLTEAAKARKVTAAGKEFVPVEEPVPVQLTVGDMNDEFLEAIYGTAVPAKERYKTLEDAIKDLKQRLPGDISAAAAEVKTAYLGKKDDEKRKFVKDSIFIMTWDPTEAKNMEAQIDKAAGAELDDLVKRALVQKVLYPLARDPWTVSRLDDALAKAKGADLDALAVESVERRLYYDILAPIQLFRPGDLKVTDIERIADRDAVKMDRVKELLAGRFDAAVKKEYDAAYNLGAETSKTAGQERDSVEKRTKIGFILFTLGQVHVPLLDKKLYPKGIERAQMVCGMHEFTNASVAYVQALRTLDQRRADTIKAEREGFVFGKEKETSTSGFITERDIHVQRLHRMVEHIDSAQKRLNELKTEHALVQKIYAQRQAQHKEVTDKLIKARQSSEKYAKELRAYQDRLHEALIELSDAADMNFRLEAEIRALELSYFKTAPKKGGK